MAANKTFYLCEMIRMAGMGLIMTLLITACTKKSGFNTDDPEAYHAFIDHQWLRVADGINELGGTLHVDSLSADLISEQFRKTREVIDNAYEEVKGMSEFKDSTYYRNAALRLISFYRTELDASIGDLVRIRMRKEPVSHEDAITLARFGRDFPVKDSAANANFSIYRKRFLNEFGVLSDSRSVEDFSE